MAKIEKLENHKIKITFEVSAPDFAQALVNAYRKTGKRYSVPGFRKGKLPPKKMIENYYGESVFYEEAFENLYRELVPAATAEADAYPAQPELDIMTIGVEEGLVFTATFESNPIMELGEYKGIELKKTDYTVHKKDVEAEVEHRLEHVKEDHARLVAVERPVENGDTVDIDYSGSVNGVKFEGGTAEHQSLEIGSGRFIPGFEEQLVGMKVGETRDINVTFPEEYHSEELAGKAAVFTVKLHSVSAKEYPEFNDEFASEISEYDTFEEYRKSIRKEVEKAKKAESEEKKANDAISKAIKNTDSFIPSDMIYEQAEAMARESMARFGAQNMDFGEFCSMFGLDPTEIIDSFKESAEMRIKSEMLFGKIADAEGIELSDEELEAEAKDIVEKYSVEETTDEDKAKMLEMLLGAQRTTLIYQLRLERARKIITDTMVIK
ncbi:MAG: trigger factor [Clostridia bacterium]|nr:trigger factor [Clostridia bacterium]